MPCQVYDKELNSTKVPFKKEPHSLLSGLETVVPVGNDVNDSAGNDVNDSAGNDIADCTCNDAVEEDGSKSKNAKYHR